MQHFAELLRGSGQVTYSSLSDSEDGGEVPDLEEISINIRRAILA
jgi:hypothetical protein